MTATEPACRDCRAEGITTFRPARPPGPRCETHHRRAQAKTRARTRERLREARYGITPEQHEALLAHQGWLCAICRRANGRTRALSVDHDHKAQEGAQSVRGLLCRPCNDLLGHVRDDITVLLRAVAYLATPPAHSIIPREEPR